MQSKQFDTNLQMYWVLNHTWFTATQCKIFHMRHNKADDTKLNAVPKVSFS